MLRDKGWDIAIAVARGGRPAVAGGVMPGVAPGALESLRQLWSQVLPRPDRSRGYCLLVTSAESNEGVSQITAGLALIGIQDRPDHRVAVVDFNLQRPTVSRLFRLPAMPGVADTLAGRLPAEETPVQTQDTSLDILPAGSLGGHSLSPFPKQTAETLMARLREDYDYILIDAPPVNASYLAANLAPLADGVLLVVRAGATRREAVIEARLRLERVGATIVGAVLNS